ncbi:MAG: FtsH protease activity modulator HflK, partial [Pseudomonadota bacterium]
ASRYSDESLMLTGDENIVDIAFTVVWRINFEEPGAVTNYLFNVRDQAENVRAVSESAMREVVGRTPIRPIITDGRDEVQLQVQQVLQQTLDSYGAGIRVLRVQIERGDPPSQVIDAFRDVQAAEADRERFRNEAEAYANTIIPEARGKANQILQEAEAYKEQVVAKAQGEADRFSSVYQQYKLAKNVTRQRIYLETLEEVLQNMEKVLIDDNAGSGVVPYLPLPEVAKRRQGDDQ